MLLDAAALPAADVKFVSSRELVATVPGTMLGSARRYIVTVSNPGGGTNLLSNATDLTVVQQFPVGASPIAVAVDTDRDLAVVTNSGDNTASLVDLTTAFNGVAGPVGAPVPTGTSPLGVAVMPRFGLALVTNNLSNNVTVIDETGVALPITATLCNNSACNGPAGVAIDQDSANAVVTNTGPNQNCPVQTVGCTATFLSLIATGTSAVFNVIVDQNPMSVAIDPDLGIASIGTSSLASSIQLFSVPGGSPLTRVANSVSLPTGMIFDPVNQVFLAANRQLNSVLIVDPSSFVATPVRSGIDPASLDYNFQTSTLVTANNASNTLSVLDYVCPPNGLPSCTAPAPQVRDVLPFSGSQQFSVAVDPKLGVVALVDQTNRRLLVIPLPH